MRTSISFLTVLAISILPAVAHASTDTFTVKIGPDTLVYSLPTSPVPSMSAPGGQYFVIQNIPATFDGNPVIDLVSFQTGFNGGAFFDQAFNKFPVGMQLFSGTVYAPTFIPGMSTLYDPNTLIAIGSVSIVGGESRVSNTPEPSSVILLGTGLVGICVAGRRRLLGSAPRSLAS